MTDPKALLYADHVRTLLARTEQALAACGYDTLLLHSGRPPDVFLDDQHYPFRVHAPFKAWVPLLDAPDSLLAIVRGERPRLVVCLPDDYWHLPPAAPGGFWAAPYDIQTVSQPGALRAALPARLGRTAFIGSPVPELMSWGVDAINPEHLMHRLDYARAAKTPWELECLREANRIGARGHLAAAAAFRAGASEFEIELAFLRACGQREQELPYNPIIALDEGAAVLHYQVLRRRAPAAARSLLIDAGADCAGYGSDITRTWARDSGDFAALIEAMDRLQRRLCAAVRPGVDWRDIHLLAFRGIGELLLEAGVLHGSLDRALESGAVATFFPHGIGHLLGAQVHDVGGLQASPAGGEIPRPPGHPFLRLTRRLEPGFVVTMEPGIYFIDSLLARARGNSAGECIDWARVATLKPYGGIRIEDDLAVTADGHENLTRPAFDAAA